MGETLPAQPQNVDNCLKLCLAGIGLRGEERRNAIIQHAIENNCSGPRVTEYVADPTVIGENNRSMLGMDRNTTCGANTVPFDETTSPIDGAKLSAEYVLTQEEIRERF